MNLRPAGALLSLALAGCGGREQASPATTNSATTGTAAASATATVTADDLIEGPTVALGIRLPLGAREVSTKPYPSYDLPASLERVASYLRLRLDAESVETGPARTIFERCRPKTATEGDLPLRIVLKRHMGGTRMFMMVDTAGVPAPPTEPSPHEVASSWATPPAPESLAKRIKDRQPKPPDAPPTPTPP